MTDTNKTSKPTAKEKRAKHANAQASYMERKRAEGKEWLATWVPGEAKDSLKKLAKQANEDTRQLDPAYITAVEIAVEASAPDWAKQNKTLFNLWLISDVDLLIDFSGSFEKEKKNKDKKKKKKK